MPGYRKEESKRVHKSSFSPESEANCSEVDEYPIAQNTTIAVV
jgi:hypothetical protein